MTNASLPLCSSPASAPYVMSRFGRPVTALVSGASRGIGLAFVHHLAAAGPARRIWAGCRDPDSAGSLAALAAEHDKVRLLALDVTDEGSLAARVGSIGDNHLGGWYAYRGAKAARAARRRSAQQPDH